MLITMLMFRAPTGFSWYQRKSVRSPCMRKFAECQAWQRRLHRVSPLCSAVAPSSVAAAASSNLPGLLLGAGFLLLGIAACIFVIVAIPAILVSAHGSGLASWCIHLRTALKALLHMSSLCFDTQKSPAVYVAVCEYVCVHSQRSTFLPKVMVVAGTTYHAIHTRLLLSRGPRRDRMLCSKAGRQCWRCRAC